MVLFEGFADGLCQAMDQFERQALASLAVWPAVQTARRLAARNTLTQPPGERILAGLVLAQRLANEHAQGRQRGIDPFPISTDLLDPPLRQFGRGQERSQSLRRLGDFGISAYYRPIQELDE
jgi:hypothetical protein